MTERKLGNHEAGSQIADSVTVVNSSVSAGVRTVVLSRGLAGASHQHYTFSPSATGIQIITASGSGPELSYHKSRGGAALLLVEAGAPLCVCQAFGSDSGSIDGVQFTNRCSGRPRSTLLEEHNDICDIATYEGGLKCCSHKSILLNKNQNGSRWISKFRQKFRIYFEEYVDQNHAFFMFITNEAGAGEYDIPQCKPVSYIRRSHTLPGAWPLWHEMLCSSPAVCERRH